MGGGNEPSGAVLSEADEAFTAAFRDTVAGLGSEWQRLDEEAFRDAAWRGRIVCVLLRAGHGIALVGPAPDLVAVRQVRQVLESAGFVGNSATCHRSYTAPFRRLNCRSKTF